VSLLWAAEVSQGRGRVVFALAVGAVCLARVLMIVAVMVVGGALLYLVDPALAVGR
jgi:hypothetical protein